jgi:hypothetical protein
LLGVGNGTFLPATQYAEANAIGVAVGDLSGDGIADVVVAKSTNLKNVAVLLGKGDGSFNSAVPYSAGTSPIAVAIADFDRDGKNDVAIANQMSNSISVYRGIGSGTLGAPLTYASDPTNAISRPDSVVVGDFNGDGKSDLAVANDVSNHVTIFLNTCTCPP